MDVLNKLSSLFQQALETREPSVDLLESFLDHWKGITNYYIQTTDESRPVRQTDIPWRLKQMLDILLYEEKQLGVEETGPCLEYLLQHKILETLVTLGKAQYPPGMSQQVLSFVSKLLVQIKKPVLHLIHIYRPIQNLIGRCGLPGSQTQKEEAEFLLVVCSRIKQEPHALHYILKIPVDPPAPSQSETSKAPAPCQSETSKAPAPCQSATSKASAPCQSETTKAPVAFSSSPPSPASDQSECSSSPAHSAPHCLLTALLELCHAQQARVSLKAHQALLQLTCLQAAGEPLAQRTQLAALLAGRLVQLYSLVSVEALDPRDIQTWPLTPWSVQLSRPPDTSASLPGVDHLTQFFSWLDFLDHLVNEAPQVLANKLADAVHHQCLVGTLQPQVLQLAEPVVLVATATLVAMVRVVRSPALLDRLVVFTLGQGGGAETRGEGQRPAHALRYQLIQNCDHISDQISMASLMLFEELLRKPQKDILSNLVVRNLEQRCFLLPPAGVEETHSTEPVHQQEELEEDPFFSDHLLPAQPLSSASPPDSSHSTDIINSFLCLVPQEVKSSQLLQEGGYDSYLLDAHKLCEECLSLSAPWAWPTTAPPPSPSLSRPDVYEGHLMQVLLDRLTCILEQPYEVNLQVTSVLSRVCAFPHPLLCDVIMVPYTQLRPGARTLFDTLIRVIGQLAHRVQQVPDVSDRLVRVRRQLLGMEPETGLEHQTLLRGIVLLEEFCKEIAAIIFVKTHLVQEAADLPWSQMDQV